MSYDHNRSGLEIIGTGVLLAFGFWIFKLLVLGLVVLVWFAWVSTANLSAMPRRMIRGTVVALIACAALLTLILLA
jgi:hypothetical protein